MALFQGYWDQKGVKSPAKVCFIAMLDYLTC